MKSRVAFGHNGQYGDLFMGVPSFSELRDIYPDKSLYITINKKYQDCAPLFFNHKYIDGIFITDGYEKLTNKDYQNIKDLNFDIIYDPMVGHLAGDLWFTQMHQVKDTALSYGLEIDNLQIELNPYFNITKFDKTIAFHPFPAFYASEITDKSPKIKRAQEIVNLINRFGFEVLQVGGRDEPHLQNTIKPPTNYFNSVYNILGCKMFIGYDSGLTWTLSGYRFPLLAMYSNSYYVRNEINYVTNIQPINSNAIYLDAPNVNDIRLEEIEEKIKLLL